MSTKAILDAPDLKTAIAVLKRDLIISNISCMAALTFFCALIERLF